MTANHALKRGETNMKDLTAFQRDLLRIIGAVGSPIGLEVKRELEKYYEEEINHGRLYPNLDTLVQEGFVEKTKKDGRTNTYSLTRKGRITLESRNQWNTNNAPDATPKNLTREA